ncbi:protein kinase domain-containing protein [Actinomadura nitritigenes]|uniref:protein kinase domain-containing protein n=1 Tax=Actinomadura nitritigenes TaxID=134602 RepID=UPI003D8DDAD4
MVVRAARRRRAGPRDLGDSGPGRAGGPVDPVQAADDAVRRVGLSATGRGSGTPHYMPPEQINGDPVTPAADVYSLGATLFHLLTGRVVFTGDNLMAIVGQHLHKPPLLPVAFVRVSPRRWTPSWPHFSPRPQPTARAPVAFPVACAT